MTFTFPDPVLLELGKVGDKDRAEMVRLQQSKVLAAIDQATNYLKTSFRIFKVIKERVTLSVNLIDFRSIGVLRSMIQKLLEPDALQLSRDIQLSIACFHSARS